MHWPRLAGPARHHRARRRNLGFGRVGVDRLAGGRISSHHTHSPRPLAFRNCPGHHVRHLGRLGRSRRRFHDSSRARRRRRRDFHPGYGRRHRGGRRNYRQPHKRLRRRGGSDLAANGRRRRRNRSSRAQWQRWRGRGLLHRRRRFERHRRLRYMNHSRRRRRHNRPSRRILDLFKGAGQRIVQLSLDDIRQPLRLENHMRRFFHRHRCRRRCYRRRLEGCVPIARSTEMLANFVGDLIVKRTGVRFLLKPEYRQVL